MRPVIKAVLLSLLLFPGTGHLVIGHRRRGWLLVLGALLLLGCILLDATRQATTILEQLTAGDIPLTSAAILDQLQRTAASRSPASRIAPLLLLACWLFGAVDAWRLGRTPRQPGSTA